MNTHIDIELIESSIKNGRIYFNASEKSFFPHDCFASRSGKDGKGSLVEFVAGGERFQTDIRLNSTVKISPRKSFAKFLKLAQAVEGAMLRVTRVAEREYQVDYLG